MKSYLLAPHWSHDLASLVFILFFDGTKAFPPSSHCPLRSGLAPSHPVGLRLNIITSKRLSPMAPSKIAAKSGLQSSPQPQTINATGYPEDSWPHTHSVDPKIKTDPPGLLRKLFHTNWGVHLLVCPLTIHSPLFWSYIFYFMWGVKIPPLLTFVVWVEMIIPPEPERTHVSSLATQYLRHWLMEGPGTSVELLG